MRSDGGHCTQSLTYRKYLTVYLVANGTAINISIFTLDVAAATAPKPYTGKSITKVDTASVLRDYCQDWEPEAMQVLAVSEMYSIDAQYLCRLGVQCLTESEMSRWAVGEVEELPTYSCGRVVLIGDAVNKYRQRSSH
jgi:hypothetical protein